MNKESLYRIFSKMPELETPRLILRRMKVSDSADMYDYARRPEVTRYLLWRPHTDVEYTRRYLEYLGGRYRIGAHYEWAVIHKQTDRMIGTCGFARVDTAHNCAELGYVLHPDFHGQGIMTEACERVLQFGFQVLGLNRIEARYMFGNDASRRVMNRIGMLFEGVQRSAMLVKGSYRDIATCAILAKDYRARKTENNAT